MHDLFGDELAKLQGLAVGVSVGLVRDLVTDKAPPAFRSQIIELFNGLTKKLGGRKHPGTDPDDVRFDHAIVSQSHS